MDKNDIIKAYCRIRKIDNTIPDDVLDFMKDSAIKALDKESSIKTCEVCGIFVFSANGKMCMNGHHADYNYFQNKG